MEVPDRFSLVIKCRHLLVIRHSKEASPSDHLSLPEVLTAVHSWTGLSY